MLLGSHTMSKPAERNSSFWLKVSGISVHHGKEDVTGQSSSPDGSQAVRRDSACIHCLSPFSFYSIRVPQHTGCYATSIAGTVTNTPN